MLHINEHLLVPGDGPCEGEEVAHQRLVAVPLGWRKVGEKTLIVRLAILLERVELGRIHLRVVAADVGIR
eukprot:3288632-Lingulodinium_polyedra.AAC.1